jgi:DNA processing protein
MIRPAHHPWAHLPPIAWALALASLPGVWPGRLRQVLDTVGPEEGFARAARGVPLCPADDPDREKPVPAGEPHDPHPAPTVVDVPALFPEPAGPAKRSLIHERCRAAQSLDVVALWERHLRWEGSIALRGEPGYPPAVAADRAAPGVLCWLGDVDVLDGPRTGIVGTRRCTGYGRDLARRFGEELATAGVGVVSGLAWGIDGSAHEGALRAAFAPPIAVVGSGLDHVYPRRHRDLWARVAEAGVILSEWPLGVRPTPWRFPARNRIIAALAPVLVVVESHAKGGSLTTAREASDRGHEVMAVPGPLTNPAAAGTNDLLAEGALVIRGTSDILTALARVTPVATHQLPLRPAPDAASHQEASRGDELLEVLISGPATLDDLVARTDHTVDHVAAGLAHLESAGLVGCTGGWWEARVR